MRAVLANVLTCQTSAVTLLSEALRFQASAALHGVDAALGAIREHCK